MLLSAIMQLNASSFTGGLAGARSAIGGTLGSLAALAGVTLSVGGIFAGLKNAMNLGGELKDLRAATGMSVSDLTVLRQAFEDCGVGADSARMVLGQMQKAIGGINDEGQPTNKTFARMGLNLAELQKMDPSAQLNAIGAGIRSLSDPAERTAAAMGIFGRSGGKMLAFFEDPGAIKQAAEVLGDLPATLDRNAGLFDNISDSLGHIKAKTQGLFAGMAEGLAPALDSIAKGIDGLDLTSIGRKIGDAIAIGVEAFKSGKITEIAKLSLTIAFQESINFLAGTLGSGQFWKGIGQLAIGAFEGLGAALIKIFTTPINMLQAAADTMYGKVAEGLGKIPGLGKMMGLEGYKSEGFSERYARYQSGQEKTFMNQMADAALKDSGERIAEGMKNVMEGSKSGKVFNSDDEKARLFGLFAELKSRVDATRTALQDEAKKPASSPTGALQAVKESKMAAVDVASDRLARVGLFVGNGPGLDYARRTAAATERGVVLTQALIDYARTHSATPTLVWAEG